MDILSELSNIITQKAITFFYINVNKSIKWTNHVCCYSTQFVDHIILTGISDNDLILIFTFELM